MIVFGGAHEALFFFAPMRSSVVVVGLGELGGVFARGFLRLGHPVVPVTRSTSAEQALGAAPEPRLVLVTVGEDDLDAALDALPAPFRAQVGLVQNELYPSQWMAHGTSAPTVVIVWFEKKRGRDVIEVRPTLVSGPAEQLVVDALSALSISASVIAPADLAHELCVKNLYILTLNLAGLEMKDGKAGELLGAERSLFDELVPELIRLERALFGEHVSFDDARLRLDLEKSIQADPAHGCAGRSAPRRLERNIAHARRLGLDLPCLERLAKKHLA